MASIFGITAAAMQQKIAPSATDYAFTIGVDGDLSDAQLGEIVQAAESEVLGYLAPKYQELMRRVPGESLCDYAAGGETEFALGLAPATAGTVDLYKNFPRARAWSQRRPADRMPAGGYTVDESTGAVVLATGLEEGDRLWAVYAHAAAGRFHDLRKNAMDLAAAEIARRFAYFRSADGFERFDAWEVSARSHLRDVLRKGGGSIEELERLRLVTETRGSTIAEILGD